MSTVEFHLRTLGEFSLRRRTDPDRVLLRASKALMIVALLAMAPRQTARRDHLAVLLWPDSDPIRARSSLRQALFYLGRRASARLVSGGDRRTTVELDVRRIAVDVWDFERALRDRRYLDAIRTHRGEFLPGMGRKVRGEVQHLVGAERARLWTGVQAAYTRLISERLAAGDVEAAILHAHRYAEVHPGSLPARATLIEALRAGGYELEASDRMERTDRPTITDRGERNSGTSAEGVCTRVRSALGRMVGLCGLPAARARVDAFVRSR